MFGLPDDTIRTLHDVFARHKEIQEVVIFGSRARGDCREGSDIDLSLKGKDITHDVLYRLEEDLDSLLLPYLFDISIYAELHNPDFINSIDREGKVIYPAFPVE